MTEIMLKRTYHINHSSIHAYGCKKVGLSLSLWQTCHALQQTLRKMNWMLMGHISSQMSNYWPSTTTLTFNWLGWRILFAYSLTEVTILLNMFLKSLMKIFPSIKNIWNRQEIKRSNYFDLDLEPVYCHEFCTSSRWLEHFTNTFMKLISYQ